MKRPANRHQPTLESLESRQLLAGNVSIDTRDGNMVITGDALSNKITIRQTGVGQYVVAGDDGEQFRTPGGNFQKGPVMVANVRGGLLVSLGSGNDSVRIHGLSSDRPIAAFVTVLTGPGQDTVELDQLESGGWQYPPQIVVPNELNRQRGAIGEAAYRNAVTPGSVTIDSGAGDRATDGDSVALRGVSVQGPTMINTGAGADLVTLDEVTGRQGVIGTAAGADHVELAVQGGVVFDTLNMALGDDSDRVNIGTEPFVLTGFTMSRFDGGRGLNYLTGYANLNAQTRARLVNPRTTGFVVDPIR